MRPIPFEQANKILSSPDRPHTQELEAFVAGGPVWLRVMKEGMEPCWISVESPFLEEPAEDEEIKTQRRGDVEISVRKPNPKTNHHE